MSELVSTEANRFLVAGLGNPGKNYQSTRHNIGFIVVDELVRESDRSFREEKVFKCELAEVNIEGQKVMVIKPNTFMNLSGEAVGAVASFFKIPTTQCLIIVDDVALDFGRLRLRGNGSSGGHNGLKSVIDHFGESYSRLRIGVGRKDAPGECLVGHVLGRFTPDERQALQKEIVPKAVSAAKRWVTAGLERAMNEFNSK
ncbi:MAG: aminoacyl-tRNA hydrolase [Verrucomicrobiota bacterium]|nr:aminoacyl-tRNA hydrolase [Verrucomicrobiota bacterium]